MTYSKQVSSRFLKCAEAPRSPSDFPRARASDTAKQGLDVTDPSGIRAAAEKFIERFGRDARKQAIIRADELLLAGNFQGRTRWQLIAKEVEHLLENSKLLQKTALN